LISEREEGVLVDVVVPVSAFIFGTM